MKTQWVEFGEVVDEPSDSPFSVFKPCPFKPCPVCGGVVMQERFGGSFPFACDPQCVSCGATFVRRDRWFKFVRGFDVVLKPVV